MIALDEGVKRTLPQVRGPLGSRRGGEGVGFWFQSEAENQEHYFILAPIYGAP